MRRLSARNLTSLGLFGAVGIGLLVLVAPIASATVFFGVYTPYPDYYAGGSGWSLQNTAPSCGFTGTTMNAPAAHSASWLGGNAAKTTCANELAKVVTNGTYSLGTGTFNGLPRSVSSTQTWGISGYVYLNAWCPNGGWADAEIWVNLTFNLFDVSTGQNLSSTGVTTIGLGPWVTTCGYGLYTAPAAYSGTPSPASIFVVSNPALGFVVYNGMQVTSLAQSGPVADDSALACAEFPVNVDPLDCTSGGSATDLNQIDMG